MRKHEAYEFATAHNETLTIEHSSEVGDEDFDEFVGLAPTAAKLLLSEYTQVRDRAILRDARRLAAFLQFHTEARALAEVLACLQDGRWTAEVEDFHETYKGRDVPATLEFASALERVPEHRHRYEKFVHREMVWPGQPGKTQTVHEFKCEVPRCGYRQMIWVDCARQGCDQ